MKLTSKRRRLIVSVCFNGAIRNSDILSHMAIEDKMILAEQMVESLERERLLKRRRRKEATDRKVILVHPDAPRDRLISLVFHEVRCFDSYYDPDLYLDGYSDLVDAIYNYLIVNDCVRSKPLKARPKIAD